MQQKNVAAIQNDAAATAKERNQHCSIQNGVNRSQVGKHLILDYWDCDASLMINETALTALLTQAAHAAGATVMSTHSHRFGHQGVTAVAILAESHISIHTWPESSYAGVDIYTCGKCDPLLAHETLANGLSARRSEIVRIARGKYDSHNSIMVVSDEPSLATEVDGNDAWFQEDAVPGCRHGNVSHGFNISELVHKGHTQFQEYLIFDNPVYGRVLVLDGIVQLSTSDEYIYHEMLIHPTMFTHPNPRRVVIVGGGDGGALREVLKHDPEQVVMIDIDEQFVRAAAKHMPSISAGAFDDPRVTLLFEDASEALKQFEGKFDVAIIDCNDAVGPSEALFEEDFYTTVANSLTVDGMCAVQAGSMLEEEFLQQTHNRMTSRLGRTTGFRLTMPSYHCGEYVFLVASKSCDPSGPVSSELAERQSCRGVVTKHWSPAMHHASQVLPPLSQLW